MCHMQYVKHGGQCNVSSVNLFLHQMSLARADCRHRTQKDVECFPPRVWYCSYVCPVFLGRSLFQSPCFISWTQLLKGSCRCQSQLDLLGRCCWAPEEAGLWVGGCWNPTWRGKVACSLPPNEWMGEKLVRRFPRKGTFLVAHHVFCLIYILKLTMEIWVM